MLESDKITRSTLLPFGPNWVPIIEERISSKTGENHEELLQSLRKSHGSGLALLLCAILANDGGRIVLPCEQKCRQIASFCVEFSEALAGCQHAEPLLGLPSSLLGRLARSTSCVVSPPLCISVALQVAHTAPSALRLPVDACGYIWICPASRPSSGGQRLLTISLSSSIVDYFSFFV